MASASRASRSAKARSRPLSASPPGYKQSYVASPYDLPVSRSERRPIRCHQSLLRGERSDGELIRDSAVLTIAKEDAQRREMTLHVAAAELKRRGKAWAPRKPYARRGALAKYARSVSSASLGAVTDLEQGAE